MKTWEEYWTSAPTWTTAEDSLQYKLYLSQGAGSTTNLLLNTNAGEGSFKKVSGRGKLGDGSPIEHAGLTFRFDLRRSVVENFSPCCLKRIGPVTASRQKQLYLACSACRSPMLRAPGPSMAKLSPTASPRVRLSVVDLAPALEAWCMSLYSPFEATLTALALQGLVREVFNWAETVQERVEADEAMLDLRRQAAERWHRENRLRVQFANEFEAALVKLNPDPTLRPQLDSVKADLLATPAYVTDYEAEIAKLEQ